MKEKVIIIFAILVGAWLGNRFKLPSGVLVGGMVAGLVAKGFISVNIPGSNILSIISQLAVAYVVVSNSDVETIKQNPQVIPVALGYIVVLILFCLGMALVLYYVFHIDLRTAIFATAPGGLSGMALSMADAGAETPISMMFHLFRLTLILVTTPLLASLFAK
jgi:membrane AbrB-like protein